MNNHLNAPRIAIIGCGALTRIFYLPVLKKIGINPSALVDPDVRSIEGLVKESGATHTAPSIEEVIDSIDAAIIASPNYLHVSQAAFLLNRGKHVLLEKPMAAIEKDAEELNAVSQQKGAVLQIGMMRRYWKINKAVKSMLEDNILGTVENISMQEGGVLNWPAQSTAIFNPSHSLGGVLMDTGSHTLDLLCWWVGNDDYELQYEDDNHGGVEADCRLNVEFKETGTKAEIKLSRIRNMPNEFVLTGKKGWIKLKPYANLFESSDRNIEKYIYNHFSSVSLKQQSFEDLFEEQVLSWLSAIKQGSKPVIDAESVLQSIRMIEQSYLHRKQIEYVWN